MFNAREFLTSTTWDLEHKIFYHYCDWCFANELDSSGADCEECQRKFWLAIKERKDKGIT